MWQFVTFALCLIAVDAYADARITNNNVAAPGEFPYQVSLQLDGVHQCGGALIGRRHVLTSASCVNQWIASRVPKNRLKAVVGSTSVNGGTKLAIDRVSRHGAFNPVTLYADVAVIRLTASITESDSVKPIALPTPTSTLYEGNWLVVSGFGSSYRNGPISPVLQKATVQAIGYPTCQQYYPTMILGPGQMCAYSQQYAICSGDGGNPVTVDRSVLVGLASGFSPYGCGVGVPDMFTFIVPYLGYIYQEMILNVA